MNGWRPVLLAVAVALAGAAGTLVVGRLAGMSIGEVAHLGLLLLPAVAATAVATVAARRLLARASIRARLVAVAAIAAVLSLANLGVLAWLMFVSAHDALLVGALVVYSVGAGVGAAFVLSRGTAAAVERVGRAAGELSEGNLDARVGPLEAGPEIEALARAVDAMAERVQSALAAERQADARRRDLITAVSHDLRTPLAGLRAMVEAIEDGVVDDPPTLRRYATEMGRQVETVTGLVDDLFELAALDIGAIEAETERARLEEVVHSAIAACEPQAAAKGLVVERRLDGADGVWCSPRLVRVLQNLLQNAIRHTPADGSVRIEARRGSRQLEVSVEDTGQGIPPEAASRVFEPFWRGDAARSSPGSGLGLALAKRIVEALGGNIQMESSPARGSRFAILLPYAG
jgi:signal transduction histidine kinase